MKKIVLLGALITVLTANTVIYAKDYYGHWAESSINNLRDLKILTGDDEGNFNPNNYMKRSEFVKVINKTFGFTEKSEDNFPDINGEEWYAEEFKIAKKAGYIKGDDLGNANPDSNITRAEVCVILDRVIKEEKDGKEIVFEDDIDIPEWAKASVYRLVKLGLINGYEDSTFKSSNNITRAECSKILDNTIIGGLNKIEKEEEQKPEEEKSTEPEKPQGGGSSSGGSSSGGSSSGGSSGGGTSTQKEYYGYISKEWQEINVEDIIKINENTVSTYRIHDSYARKEKCIEYQYDNDEIVSDYSGELLSIADKYKDGEEHILKIRVILPNGDKAEWKTYKFVYEIGNLYYGYLKVDGNMTENYREYEINDNTELKIYDIGSREGEILEYQFDEGEIIKGSNGEEIIVPEVLLDGRSHTIKVRSIRDEEKTSNWREYIFVYREENIYSCVEKYGEEVNKNEVIKVTDNSKIVIIDREGRMDDCLDYQIDEEAIVHSYSGVEIETPEIWKDGEEHTLRIRTTFQDGRKTNWLE